MADPIGERIQVDWENPDSLVRVVGVVGDVLNGGLDGSARAMIYYAHRQMPFDLMTLVVRSKGEPEALIGSVRAQVAAMDKNLPIHSLVPMRELLTASMSGRRYPMFLLSLLSTVALILAAVGIYGVLGYLVTQRTKEIGLRVALGASGIDVLRSVVGRGLGLVLLGLALGIGGALVATRALGNLLYGVTSADPMTFLGVSALLMLVAAIASYLPARRATRVDPMVALRSD